MIYRYAARCVNSLPLSNGRWSLFFLYIYIYILFFFLFFLIFIKYFFYTFHFVFREFCFILFLFICRWRFSSYETLMQYVNASCYLRIIKCIGWNICHVYSVCAYFLNSSNKSCEIILYQLLIVYIWFRWTYIRSLRVESIFWSDGICILRPFCRWRPRIHRKTIVFAIYDHDDKSIGHRCFERGRNFIKVTNYSIYSNYR